MGTGARHHPRRGALAAAILLASAGGAASASACGAGELALPGTTSCLRLGGLVRAEATAAPGTAPIVPAAPDGGRRRAASIPRTEARVHLDARVPTAYGPLRAYVAVQTGGLGRR